jgi:VWFA-related protein
MTRLTTSARRALVVVAVLALAAPTVLADDGFGSVVKKVESHYKAKRRSIPFLGLAGFVVKIVKPAGVKSFKLAVFEDQDFSPGPADFDFERAIGDSLGKKWQPLVRSRLLSSGTRAYVYSQPSGKDIKLLVATFDRRQAIIVEAKVDPDRLMSFIEKPELLGYSLTGRSSPSIDYSYGHSSDLGDNARPMSLEGANVAGTSDASADSPKTKPTLRRGSNRDAEFNPLANTPTPVSATTAAPERDVLRLEARLVNLNVKATDRNGNALSDLKKGDFEIYEDGERQAVAYFEPLSARINLVLLLDMSGSTQRKRDVMIKAARGFIDSLAQGDRIAICAFTRRFVVISEFSTDKKLLKKRLDKVKKIQGGTAYYDAMWATLDLLDHVDESRKAIVVLTDGVDNSLLKSDDYESTEHTFEDLMSRVAEEDATIYPIQLNTAPRLQIWDADAEDEDRVKRLRARFAEKIRPYEVAGEQLQAISDQTAGILFKADDERDLEGVYKRVAAELHLLYSLAYAPTRSTHHGEFRKVTVTVKRTGAVARTRRGYYAR